MKRLFWDVETSPCLALVWRVGYKINISYENIVSERKVICIAYKWQGEKKVHSLTWDGKQDDAAMLRAFMPVLASADESVAHFGDSFDLPWVRTRCLVHGIPTLPSYKTIDTLKWARGQYYFQSNKLDYLAKFLGLGGKLRTEDGLWRRIVLDKDDKALRFMAKYNCVDVELLEKVYNRLAPMTEPKTHLGVLGGGEKWSCPHCASKAVKLNQTRVTAKGSKQFQFKCANNHYYSISAASHKDFLKNDRRALQ